MNDDPDLNEIALLKTQVEELRERVETTQEIAVELGKALLSVINASLTVASKDWSPYAGTPIGDALVSNETDPIERYNEAFDAIAAALLQTIRHRR